MGGYLPGVATASETMLALGHGYRSLKFFPAEAAGGAACVKAFGGPFPQVRFWLTGGVTPGNAAEYLRLSNVVCVGGSWIASEAAMQRGDWAAIEDLARQAVRLP